MSLSISKREVRFNLQESMLLMEVSSRYGVTLHDAAEDYLLGVNSQYCSTVAQEIGVEMDLEKAASA